MYLDSDLLMIHYKSFLQMSRGANGILRIHLVCYLHVYVLTNIAYIVYLCTILYLASSIMRSSSIILSFPPYLSYSFYPIRLKLWNVLTNRKQIFKTCIHLYLERLSKRESQRIQERWKYSAYKSNSCPFILKYKSKVVKCYCKSNYIDLQVLFIYIH